MAVSLIDEPIHEAVKCLWENSRLIKESIKAQHKLSILFRSRELHELFSDKIMIAKSELRSVEP